MPSQNTSRPVSRWLFRETVDICRPRINSERLPHVKEMYIYERNRNHPSKQPVDRKEQFYLTSPFCLGKIYTQEEESGV
jgi:hypothetical protein